MGLPTSFVHKKSCNSKFVIWGVAELVSQRLLTSRNGQVQTDARTDGNRGGRPLLHRPLPPPAPPSPPTAGAWRFPERTAVAVDLRQHRRRQLLRGNGREQH